ncbi:MAG: structure-specific recognition protein-domain-containing protein [Monoraphidium minutum]|nr:MAG: structure-specific recognition protein-domain-containing protein [Monoraphidium minutum]
MAAEVVQQHQFGNISLSSRGGAHAGLLRVTPNGLVWRSQAGGKTVDVKKDDVTGLLWTKIGGRGCQLGVTRKEGATVNFVGFRDKDFEGLAEFFQASYGSPLQQQQLSVSGGNWGSVSLRGSSLKMARDGKVLFEVPLPDVSQAQQAKDEVMLEFHVDDTAADDKEDTLVEMAFHVPPGCKDWAPPPPEPQEGEEGAPPPPAEPAAKVLLEALMEHTDAGGTTSDDAVAIFDDVAVLAPRGRFEVEMHAGFLKMVGQTQDFKIRYTSIVRLFLLPKSATPHTLVVISLDPPIRKGQTFYSHLLCQFPSDVETEMELDMSEEQMAARNDKGAKLTRKVNGPISEVFTRVLKGLSGAKLTRAGAFRNSGGDGPAVRCTFKADDGFLYPLERAFFYVHKPPLLFMHDDIESCEFQRQGGGVISGSVRTFDLVIRLRNNPQEFMFRNINRTEWQGLFEFINSRRIRIEHLKSAREGPLGPGQGIDVGDDMDAGMRAVQAEAGSDEDDDEDFDGKAPSSADAPALPPPPNTHTRAHAPNRQPAKKAKKAAAAAGGDGGDGKPAKKARKKKDPNAPKKAMSGFMYFSTENRERVKRDNEGIAFGQVAKVLGEEWKALDTEGRAKYEAMAAKDKERYAAAMAEYKAGGGGGGEGGGAADAGGDDDGWASGGEGGGEGGGGDE